MKKLIIISIVVTIVTITFFVIINPFFKLELINKKNITINYGDKYKEYGVKANSLLFNLNKKVKVTGKVNVKRIGKYIIEYKVKYLFKTKKLYRTITIVDKENPVITLNGDINIELFVGDNYEELGYNASDNYDKDLTDKVVVDSNLDTTKVGDYTIKYSVKDSSSNYTEVVRNVKVKEKTIEVKNVSTDYTDIVSSDTPTYINGILIVNKKYSLPSNYNPGVDNEAANALSNLQSAAAQAGYSMPLLSGFRSYETQKVLYNSYVAVDGVEVADTYSARPGHSEHQTGLAFDVGELDYGYGDTAAGAWLREHAHEYGFIIRYLKGKENITGYNYEPWHIRYVGANVATEIYNRGITLEEYLGI